MPEVEKRSIEEVSKLYGKIDDLTAKVDSLIFMMTTDESIGRIGTPHQTEKNKVDIQVINNTISNIKFATRSLYFILIIISGFMSWLMYLYSLFSPN